MNEEIEYNKILNNKKHIFFDIGYTLDQPASGDWMFTNLFYSIAGQKFLSHSKDEISAAYNAGLSYLIKHHFLSSESDEIKHIAVFYSMISNALDLGFSDLDSLAIAKDRTENMTNYVVYDDAAKTLNMLKKNFTLGIISDTWPSVTTQLKHIGLYEYFDTFTYSFEMGVMKPDERMYLDALSKCKVKPQETVFIDDSIINLSAAEKLGITPILIAANPASDIESPFYKIHSLKELIVY